MPRLRRTTVLRALVATLATAIGVTVAGGGLYLLGPPARDTAAGDLTGDLAGGSREIVPLEHLRPAVAPPPAAADRTRRVTPTPPGLFGVARASVTPATLDRISRLTRVRKVTVADAGAITFSGHAVNLLAVDPVEFRPWVPKAVADQPAIWDALTRGELVADTGAARRLGLRLGASYQADGGPRLRVAAAARIGLPGVDGLVATETGRTLGLPPRVAVLVHHRGEPGRLGVRVRRALGEGAQVVDVPGHGGAPERDAPGPRRVLVGRPESYLELYRLSARVCPGLSWTVLAAIGQVESSHGRDNGPSSAGALGPMQFMPATWKIYGVDGDGDGVADIWNPYDAVPSAANYLCATGAGRGGERLEKAVWHYNHSWSYVAKVLAVARGYAHAYPDR